jgi:TonB family protein
MTTMRRPPRLIWPGSFLIALAAHSALLSPWIWHDSDALAGAGGQQLDVISVVMVNPGVLESREINRTLPVSPASAAPVEINEGAPAAEQSQAKKDAPEPEKQPPREVQTADAILEVKPETPKQEKQQSTTEGGAAARGDAVAQTKPSGPAAASAGAVREYARWVAQALAKRKPRGIGARGTVKIKFIIAETGRLSSIEVSKSSGDKRLDQMALHAVQQAVFPVPPRGMTVAQLTYEVPYQFR